MDAAFGLHPETIADRPELLRWVTTAELPAIGRLVGAPGELGLLLKTGLIAKILLERSALWVWLADADWAAHGTRVRDAISAAAEDLPSWQIEPADDEICELVARDVIERSLGAYIASHGGGITLLRVADGIVEVALEGSCAGCPAAGLTLHGRIEAAIRARLTADIEVHATGEAAHTGLANWWPKLLRLRER